MSDGRKYIIVKTVWKRRNNLKSDVLCVFMSHMIINYKVKLGLA